MTCTSLALSETLELLTGADLEGTETLVLFASDSCGAPCKDLEAALVQVEDGVTDAVGALFPNFAIGWMDVHAESKLVEEMAISGAPTIALVYDDGVAQEYGGPIEQDAIVSWVLKWLSPIFATQFETAKVGETWLQGGDMRVLVQGAEATRVRDVLAEHLGTFREFVAFAVVNSTERPENEEKADKTKSDETRKSKNGEHKLSFTVRKWGVDEVKKFSVRLTGTTQSEFLESEEYLAFLGYLLKNQAPFMGEIDLSSVQGYLTNDKPFIWLVSEDQKDYQPFREKRKPLIVPGKFQRDFQWVYLNTRSRKEHAEFTAASLAVRELPALVCTDLDGSGRFFYPGNALTDNNKKIAAWIERMLRGKEKRHLLSETLPKEKKNSSDPFIRATSNTLMSQLRENSGPGLVVLDSVWCEKECSKFAARVGKSELVKKCVHPFYMDVMKNELDPTWNMTLDITPTIYLFPESGNKKSREKSVPELAKPLAMPESIAKGSIEDIMGWITSQTKCKIGSSKDEL